MRIEQIQRHLEHIYGLIPTPSVRAFLINEEELCRALPGEPRKGSQVLIHEDNEEVRLGVHLNQDVLQKLETPHPSSLHLPSFLSAAEEISHFLFLVWSLLNQRPVSLLDVEVQGEIDKFLLASELVPNERTLLNVLFGHPDYDPSLSPDSLARYEEANRLGWKFCRSFLEAQASQRQASGRKRLRTFYRMTSQARLSHIALL